MYKIISSNYHPLHNEFYENKFIVVKFYIYIYIYYCIRTPTDGRAQTYSLFIYSDSMDEICLSGIPANLI